MVFGENPKQGRALPPVEWERSDTTPEGSDGVRLHETPAPEVASLGASDSSAPRRGTGAPLPSLSESDAVSQSGGVPGPMGPGSAHPAVEAKPSRVASDSLSEAPYPEAPLASRKAPLSEREASTREWAGTPDSSGLAQAAPGPSGTRSESRADFKKPKRVRDKSVYGEFHALGLTCLHCKSRIIEAAHLLRGKYREDVLDALIPLCRFCHEAFDTAQNVYYPIFVSVRAVRASVARFLRSDAGQSRADYLVSVLGPFGAEDFVQRLEAA